MGYEQLSTVVVLLIVLIGIVVWLPARTARSMRHVEEHREDRYSSSLHLVDEHSGTRFSDDGTYAKGVLMQPNERRANTLTPERIAQVRRLRRQAVRRRRILVSVLAVLTVVVAVAAFPLRFSPWFALIPAALVAASLVLGARAARQARQWERKVTQAKARARRAKAARVKAQVRAVAEETAKASAQVGQDRAAMPASDGSNKADGGDETPTAEMERREIRRVLRQAEIEQHEALAAKGRIDAEPPVQAVATASETSADPAPAEPSSASAPAQPAAVLPETGAPAPAPAADDREPKPQVSDATTEVAEVRPAAALDAFDMATASQDLISFSLGEARNTAPEHAPAPESREIRSMRQVAKATPVDADEERALVAEAKVETEPARTASDDADARDGVDGASRADRNDGNDDADDNDDTVLAAVPQDSGVSDVAAFHQSEERARVAVPAATSDSLGNDLQAILDRRGV